MSISDNIKTIRDKYKLTQAQLGKIAGVSDKAVSSWETGSAEPRMGNLQRIADHFNIKISSLIDGINISQDNNNGTISNNINSNAGNDNDVNSNNTYTTNNYYTTREGECVSHKVKTTINSKELFFRVLNLIKDMSDEQLEQMIKYGKFILNE